MLHIIICYAHKNNLFGVGMNAHLKSEISKKYLGVINDSIGHS
jgi:hypothetical protein